MFVALVLGMVSCQNYLDDFDVNIGGEKEVVVSVSLPEGTRANSAVGAISNNVVESDEYTLRYIFQIWDEAKQQKKDAVMEYSDDTKVSFPVRLMPGRNYRFVVWADVVREDKKEDLHYNTANFPTISVNTDSWVAMDETRDAYTASELIKDFGSAQNYTLTLKRPFAKLRVITTDMDELMGVVPTTATVTYTTEYYNSFNALENKAVRESKNENKEHKDYTIKEYELTNGKVLFTDYFFAENDAVSFNLSVNMSDNGEPITRNFNTDIPVNRNHLTTLIGNILTEGDNIEVRIEEGFDGEIEEVYPPASIDPNRVIRYTATEKVVPYKTDAFGANIISNTWDKNTGEGCISFDNDVTTIGISAFYRCDKLKGIILNKSIKSIENYAFEGCTALAEITIPANVDSIGCSFVDCTSLSSVVFEKGETHISISYGAFDGVAAALYVDRDIKGYAISFPFENAKLKSITIGPNMKHIEDCVFGYCEELQSLIFEGESQVETIGRYAFAASNIPCAVHIPKSVIEIDPTAFALTTGITNFTSESPYYSKGVYGELIYNDRTLFRYPSTRPYDGFISSGAYDKIGAWAFSGCDIKRVYLMLYDAIEIGDYAFWRCKDLKEFIPYGAGHKLNISFIGDSAFGETAVEELNFLDSTFASINATFRGCEALHTLYLPATLTEIGEMTFHSCSSLTSLYIAATTPPTLSSDAFNVVSNELSIYIPAESVEAYKNAENWSEYSDRLVAYDFENGVVVTPKPANNEIWYTSVNEEVIDPYNVDAFDATIVSNTYENGKGVIEFDGDVTSIGQYAFNGCNSLTSITIPNSVTSIEYGAFYHCASLKSIALPDNLTTISTCTFDGCSSLESIIIPDAVTEIGVYAFCECVSLESVVIGSRVTSIRGSAFILCDNLKSVYISDMSAWCKIEFGYWSHSNPLKNGAKLYLNNIEVTELTIPSDITEIYDYTFEGCISLTSLTIPDSVTSIGEGAFALCDNLKSVRLGNCVASIEKWAFDGCDSLESITIPDSVTSIGQYAFNGCISLNSVYCKPTTPPTLVDSFDSNAYGRIIYVPYQSVDAYKTASSWSNYANSIEGYDFQ